MRAVEGSRLRQRTRAYGGSNRHAALAWLPIVALLINALMPAGFAAAPAPQAPLAASGAFCGATPGETGPAKQIPLTRHHCVLCLAAAAGGLLPTPQPALLPRQYTETATEGFLAWQIAPTRFAYASARPRGPPISG
jgi:hypothetical protein